jgi:hypothetical protein
MKVATVSVFAAAAIGSTVGLKGTTPPTDHPTAKPAQHQPVGEAPPRKAQ